MDPKNFHSIIWGGILQRPCWMQTKSFLKILLLSVYFEIITSVNLSWDQSQHFKRSTVRLSLSFSLSHSKFIYTGEFLKVNARQTNFQEWLCVHSLSLCKISSKFTECKIFVPYDFLEISLKVLLHTLLSLSIPYG